VTLETTMEPSSPLGSARFFRTGYLPTYAAVFYLLLLVWAGAPGRAVSFSRAWRTAERLGVAEVLLLALAVALIAVLVQPLQLSVVRVLEGGFPRWLGSGLFRKIQLDRKGKLETKVQKLVDNAAKAAGRERDARTQEAGAASVRFRSRYPGQDHLVKGTALGNALAAMEDSAGAAYGLDAAVIWPRLYAVLGQPVRAVVDDLRDGLDGAASLTASGALAAMAAVALLVWHSGLLTLLALIPVAVASLAYLGAIRAATAYGTAVQVAFDLHRFDLLRAMRLALPADQQAEQEANVRLCDFLRQGVQVPFTYTLPGCASQPGGG
jgi:hypothetical protein